MYCSHGQRNLIAKGKMQKKLFVYQDGRQHAFIGIYINEYT